MFQTVQLVPEEGATIGAAAARWSKRAPVAPAVRYLKREEMKALAFASPHRKVIARLLQAPSA